MENVDVFLKRLMNLVVAATALAASIAMVVMLVHNLYHLTRWVLIR